MTQLALSSLSTQYVKVPVVATSAGAVVDPTADTVQFAFVAIGTVPGTSDWKAGSWEKTGAIASNTFQCWARCLVGPSGSANPGVGVWDVWVKIFDNPETPVIYAGQVNIGD